MAYDVNKKVTILAIDPPSKRNMGFAVIEFENKKFKILEHSTYVLDDFDTPGAKLDSLFSYMDRQLSKYKPNIFSMESSTGFGLSFVRNNLLECSGVMRLCCHRHGVAVHSPSPNHVKLVVADNGKASKTQMKKAIQSLTNIEKVKTEHEGDAVAVALTTAVDEGILDHFFDPQEREERKKKEMKEKRDRKKAEKAAKKKEEKNADSEG